MRGYEISLGYPGSCEFTRTRKGAVLNNSTAPEAAALHLHSLPADKHGAPDLQGFLRDLFVLLDSHGVRYCVLHSYEPLPEALGSDLDMAVDPSDTSKLPKVLRGLLNLRYQLVQMI